MSSDKALWRFFREVRQAVEAGNAGRAEQPYASGTFVVTAVSGDVEMTVANVSEEDAILIAAELEGQGIRALMRGTLICPACGERVPEQAHCTNCRSRLKPR